MRRVLTGCIGVLAVFLVPAFASAQSGSGIAGVVKDASGAVLPGVTVEASSPALIERSGGGHRRGGSVQDHQPAAGRLRVTFSLSGFSTVKREGIELTASFTATVNADLRVGSLDRDRSPCPGRRPTVDVQNVVQQKVMTRDVVDAIPVGAKSVMSVGVLIPGVTTNSQDVGGTHTGRRQLAIHGSVLFEQQLLYDGVLYNNGAGRGGSFTAIAPNSATIQEISYETGGLSAESELARHPDQHHSEGRRKPVRRVLLRRLHEPRSAEQQPDVRPRLARADVGRSRELHLRHRPGGWRPDREGQAVVLHVRAPVEDRTRLPLVSITTRAPSRRVLAQPEPASVRKEIATRMPACV